MEEVRAMLLELLELGVPRGAHSRLAKLERMKEESIREAGAFIREHIGAVPAHQAAPKRAPLAAPGFCQGLKRVTLEQACVKDKLQRIIPLQMPDAALVSIKKIDAREASAFDIMSGMHLDICTK
jgi:hypothetical protein